MPISLSDDELQIIMTCAAPIPPQDRDQREVANELSKYPEVGPGIVGRVVSKIQREHLNGPRDLRGRNSNYG
jgi:hypothetical protein